MTAIRITGRVCGGGWKGSSLGVTKYKQISFTIIPPHKHFMNRYLIIVCLLEVRYGCDYITIT